MGCGASAQKPYESNNAEGMGTSLNDLSAAQNNRSKSSFGNKKNEGGEAAQSCPGGEAEPVKGNCPTEKLVLDRTHDGKIDTMLVDSSHDHHYDTMMTDTTGDGRMDKILVDTTKDGKVDTIEWDTTGDGKADLVEKDTTGDGQVDQEFRDLSGDGRPDMLRWDTSGDGKFNRIEKDTDGNGTHDLIELDTNGDGKVDFKIAITGPLAGATSTTSLQQEKKTSPRSSLQTKKSLESLDEGRPLENCPPQTGIDNDKLILDP